MEFLKCAIVEELALSGTSAQKWDDIVTHIRERPANAQPTIMSLQLLEDARDALVDAEVISAEGDRISLEDDSIRLRVLGVSQLPMVCDNLQAFRVLEYIARSRYVGTWSFSICQSMRLDAKQLFHLSNVLLDYGLIRRFSNVVVPRSLKSRSTSSTATFFVHARFGAGSLDPDVADAVDPGHSTESVGSLITSLLREAGGVMLAKTLRVAVIVDGGFTGRQYQRGRDRLLSCNRVEKILIPKSLAPEPLDSRLEDLDEEEDQDSKQELADCVSAIQLVEKPSFLSPSPPASVKLFQSQGQPDVKEEDSVMEESNAEETEERVNGNENLSILVRNMLRARCGFREAVLLIIEASGLVGVTTREIATLTGIPAKEVLKSMETIKLDDRIDSVWRNAGRRKYIVYRFNSSQGLTIKIDESMEGTTPESTPMSTLSGSRRGGYVTDQTVSRASLAAEIVRDRIALSLIDLGRAIEAKEQELGVGIPGAQIDRRTLRKICDIGKISLTEKNADTNMTKLIIAYDTEQCSAEDAKGRVERPIGFTPKQQEGGRVAKLENVVAEVKKRPARIAVTDLVSRGRLAALAVFGPQASSGGDGSRRASFATMQAVAQTYGYIPTDVFRGKLLHAFLYTAATPGTPISTAAAVEMMPLGLYLQLIGCGCRNEYLDTYFSSSAENSEKLTVSELPLEIQIFLKSNVPRTSASTPTQSNQLAKAALLLIKLGLVRFVAGQAGADANAYIAEPLSSAMSVEEWWNTMYVNCMRGVGKGVLPPQLFKRDQWKSKIVVTFHQRREMEALFRRFVVKGVAVVDGSNEDLIRTCAHVRIDVATGMKILKRVQQQQSGGDVGKIVFAPMNQARFKCPHCEQLFFQLSSIRAHFLSAHNVESPEDFRQFARAEYLQAVAKLQSTSGKKRHRRRRRRSERQTGVVVDKALVEGLALTKAMLGRSPGGVDDVFWSVLNQIVFGQSSPHDVHSLYALLSSTTGESSTTAPPTPTTATNPTTEASRSMACGLVLNRTSGDTSCVPDPVRSVLREWYAAGLLVCDKKRLSSDPAGYALSRHGKQVVFGKFADLDKLVSIIRATTATNAGAGTVSVIEDEADIQESAVAVVLDGSAPVLAEWRAETSFGLGSRDEDEDDKGEEDGFAGVEKHLSLTQEGPASGTIDRVVIGHTPAGRGNAFIKELMELSQTAGSNVWRPSPTERESKGVEVGRESACGPFSSVRELMEFFKVDDLASVRSYVHGGGNGDEDRKSRDFLVNVKMLPPTAGDDGGVEPRIMADEDITPFLAELFAVSPLMYFTFRDSGVEQLRRIWSDILGPTSAPPSKSRMFPWISPEGLLREHVVADLLLNVLNLVYLNPGIRVENIAAKIPLLGEIEIEILVGILTNVGCVSSTANHGELFMRPFSSWC